MLRLREGERGRPDLIDTTPLSLPIFIQRKKITKNCRGRIKWWLRFIVKSIFLSKEVFDNVINWRLICAPGARKAPRHVCGSQGAIGYMPYFVSSCCVTVCSCGEDLPSSLTLSLPPFQVPLVSSGRPGPGETICGKPTPTNTDSLHTSLSTLCGWLVS